jgi:hypothetical protein
MENILAARGIALACKSFDGFRINAIAVAGLLLILAAGSFSQSAFAQSPCNCWIDTKTGQCVASFPVITDADGKTDWIRRDAGDRSRAYDPRTRRNLFRDPADGYWKDGKTGRRVGDYPVITDADGETDWIRPDAGDRSRAYDPRTGRNFARVDCSPPSTSSSERAPTARPSPGTSAVAAIKDGKGQLPVKTARIGSEAEFFAADLDFSPQWTIDAAKRTLTIILRDAAGGCCVTAKVVKGKFDNTIWTGDVGTYPYQRARSVTATFDAGPPGQWTYNGDYAITLPIPAGATAVKRIEMNVGYPPRNMTSLVWEMGR